MELDELVKKEVKSLGFEFIGLEFDRHISPNVLRVYVDLILTNNIIEIGAGTEVASVNARGITLDECGKIGYHLNKVLSVISSLNMNNYTLEVSSPGLERRLFNVSQCERYLGEKIKLKLYKSIEDRRNVVGLLRSVDKDLNRIFLDVEGQDLYFNFDDIAKANLVYVKS